MVVCFRKNMYAGGDSQMNGDTPHDGGHGGGGHAVGEELKRTGRYETIINNEVNYKLAKLATNTSRLFMCIKGKSK